MFSSNTTSNERKNMIEGDKIIKNDRNLAKVLTITSFFEIK